MDSNVYRVKQCKANDLECILLYRLLNIPDNIGFHPKLRRVIIITNPRSNKTRVENGKVKKVKRYCSIDIKDDIKDVLTIFKNNPFFLDYTTFTKTINPISGKRNKTFIQHHSTSIMFWIPSEQQKEKYEQIQHTLANSSS